MNIVTRKLLAKELYVNRGFLVMGSAAGIISTLIATLGKTGLNIGSLMWLTTIIAIGVMLGIYGIMHERKEHTLEFVLSLPVSIAEYVRAKVLGLWICFFIVWLASSVAALLLIFLKDSIPDGIAAYTVLLCFFMLANYGVVLCGMLEARSEAASTGIIVVTNMGISVFMFTVAPLAGIQNTMWGSTPVWNATFWTVLGCELAVLLITFSLPFLLAARRRDFF
jgi:ABC-type transport system involved in multi-copper enzyme maturation permease subunit